MNDRVSFVKAILAGNFDVAGVFADWLEENGDAKTGILLRRRWKRWQRERTESSNTDNAPVQAMLALLRVVEQGIKSMFPTAFVSFDARVASEGANMSDQSFARYIRERFPTESRAASSATPLASVSPSG